MRLSRAIRSNKFATSVGECAVVVLSLVSLAVMLPYMAFVEDRIRRQRRAAASFSKRVAGGQILGDASLKLADD